MRRCGDAMGFGDAMGACYEKDGISLPDLQRRIFCRIFAAGL